MGWIALLKLLAHWIDTEELWMSTADPHLSINIKITYMALTLDPQSFKLYCFNKILTVNTF